MNSTDLAKSLGFSDEELGIAPATAPVVTSKLEKGPTSATEQRALNLLGCGVSAESAALALGVTPARISQLMADEEFAAQVATLRYENMQKHNLRDNSYDSLEDQLLEKMENALPLMHKPETILRAINVINGAKRRGQSAPDQVINNQNIVNISMPGIIADQFTVQVDSNNRVIKAGEQELHTMPAGQLLQKVKDERAALTDQSEPVEGEVL